MLENFQHTSVKVIKAPTYEEKIDIIRDQDISTQCMIDKYMQPVLHNPDEPEDEVNFPI